jgi:DNA polymerase
MSAPFDRILALDHETAWGRAVDLGFSCQTMEEYLRDPRFKSWGLSYKEVDLHMPAFKTAQQSIDAGDAHPIWIRGKDLPDWFASIDWSRTAVVAQNAAFDVSINAWGYGAQPAFIFDTLSMGRALHGVEAGNSLKRLAERYGLEPKGDGLASSENILDELPFAIEQELSTYCKHDTWLCEQLFKLMVGRFPKSELRLIDMTLQMYTNPRLLLDQEMLSAALKEDQDALAAALALADVPEAALASNDQFADILRLMGVEPPTKTSKTTGKTTYAFAKNDALFQQMQNGDNADVALLCDARIKVKSTQARTRAQRFLDIAKRGPLPVPLAYYGAATGRWQALKGSFINLQNMKRGSALRRAIMAPDGYEVGVGDLSQIEPRVLAWLAGHETLLDIFRSGEDAYSLFGRGMFSIPNLNKEEHPVLRQSAKSAMLGAGYQLGWAAFAAQLLVGFLGAPPKRYTKAEAKQLGVTGDYVARFLAKDDYVKRMMEIPHVCTDDELLIHCVAAKKIIDLYRSASEPIVDFWDFLDQMIRRCLAGSETVTYKCLTFKPGAIVLANGMELLYPDIKERLDERGRVQYVFGPKEEKLYAGRVCNNVTQGTARIVMSDGMLRVQKYYPVVLTVHDELATLFPEGEGKSLLPWMLRQMTKEPSYMPGIPLAAEGGVHKRYGDAKK